MLTDHELLLRIDERTELMHGLLFGNGQPGLLTRVAQIEGGSKKAATGGGLAGATIALVVAAVLKQFGLV